MHKTKINQLFTYQDYLTWPEKERWEIIDGITYAMSLTIMGKFTGWKIAERIPME